ncbi:restriction endonuclease subunit S [Methanobrevibacter sp.]|uniref:restriction endonuclease subunit S n=1 Tax=Methanobrevibacter sp. TaxID=66852 RepID=UPI002A7535B9|nr:restriction endonuclease subunit S [Methanobrevibacter sp.]MDY3096280.1 restriction endonuclease subunit S [Methanobrevibacter sp.]
MKKNTIKLKSFLNQFSEIEKEKIIFFALTHEFNTLIINAPSDNAKQKIFLGYDWSNRKGAEGIQIIQAGGKLYNDTDRFATNTLASCVRMMFEKQLCQITDNHSEYAYIVNTADMLDFSLTSFNKAIRTSTQKKVEIVSKYPMVKLDAIISNIETGSRPKGGVGYISDGAYSLGGEHIGKDNGRLELKTIKYVPKEFFKNSTRGKILKNDILLCKDGALTGKVAIVKDELDGIDAMVNEHVFILRCENLTKQLYVFNYLYSEYGQLLLKNNITGSAQGGLNSTNLKNIKIPLPPLEIQEQIITECQKIDDEYENSRMAIEIYRQKITQIFDDLDVVKNSQERE